MLGFLGTVIGMVEAFYNLASAGSSAGIGILTGGMAIVVAGLIGGCKLSLPTTISWPTSAVS